MNNRYNYLGYWVEIEYSAEDHTLFGKVLDIADCIIFEIEKPEEAEKKFHEVIDDYLEMCKTIGKDPCKPYSGSLNIRIDSSLHKNAAQEARKQNITLNRFIATAIEQALYPPLSNPTTITFDGYTQNNMMEDVLNRWTKQWQARVDSYPPCLPLKQ